MLDKIDLKNYYYAYLSNKNSKLSPTTGFGVLESIVENIDYKKIVLIGFSNLTKKTCQKMRIMEFTVCIMKINIFKMIF